MKKLLLSAAFVAFGLGMSNAQDDSTGGPTSEGKWLIEANTGNAMLGTTGLYFASSGDGAENFIGETPLWLGLGAGYAWFVSDTISIEPGLRYNYSLNEDFTDQGVFQFNVGFALYF